MLRFPVSALAVLIGVSAVAFARTTSESSNFGTHTVSAAAATTTTIIGPSGLPVPRFVSLKKEKVRARFGPSFDYPVAYEFNRQGLPLKVIAEDRDNIWRRVEDRDGHRMWIHRSMLAPNEHAIVMEHGVVLRASPKAESVGRAKIAGGVMMRLETCEEGWCRLSTPDYRGWLPASVLWGARI